MEKLLKALNPGVEESQSLRFGLIILHARIFFFKTILHLAYKLPLKKWQATTPEDKKVVQENKERIQKEYRERTGLIVDMPKIGFGNSNSGNNSRRFFSDPNLAAEITGIKNIPNRLQRCTWSCTGGIQ
ncbi:unnamed protein product [Psylliodes chrysocephalus]|uniref:Uncharacterized protein n=1 Tax=Psylliodes chrysocephalus TaxID=3402493 RepID=A0A9P0CEZ9_9CUCU|nr:unnamed protein product [Psylliodes chrysocephala]